MRCETSFFSLTLFKKHLQRYWPLWAVWLAGWMLAMPVNLWNEAVWGGAQRRAERFADALGGTSVIIAVIAPMVAVCVFFHLFKSPAANFIGALPMRREGVFATAFAAGYVMLAVPILLTGFVTVLVEWAVNAVAVESLLKLMGGCLLQSFFWFSFATLCCVISGNAVAGASFYVIFNGVVMAMVWLVQTVLQAFLYGFSQFGDGLWEWTAWLTPIFKTVQGDSILAQGPMPVSRMEMLWVYAAVGFLMLLAAVGLHHVRKAERAGDLIAFGPIRWVFRVSVTLCGGLAFGLLLLALIFDGRDLESMGAALAGCCAVAAVVSWFVAEMLLQKSFKVFKSHWKGAAIGALCFVVAICAIDMDWIGFTTHVPKAEQVKSATATFGGGDADPIAREGLVYDQETVAQLIALHQYLVDHREDWDGGRGGRDYYGRLEVEYDLGLTRMRRDYEFYYDPGDPADDAFIAAQVGGLPRLDVSVASPVGGYVNIRPGTEGEDDWSRDLTPAQAEMLWKAILEDYQAGRYRADGDGAYPGSIELHWENKATRGIDYKWFYPRQGTASINAALEALRTMYEPESERTDLPTAEVVLDGGEEIVY